LVADEEVKYPFSSMNKGAAQMPERVRGGADAEK
jgi:hypothetical protein